jgi:hypothetical protein
VARRFESSGDKLPKPGQKLVGPQDNAFNRERAAVKAHAAATSGTSTRKNPKTAREKGARANETGVFYRPLAKDRYLVRTTLKRGFPSLPPFPLLVCFFG